MTTETLSKRRSWSLLRWDLVLLWHSPDGSSSGSSSSSASPTTAPTTAAPTTAAPAAQCPATPGSTQTQAPEVNEWRWNVLAVQDLAGAYRGDRLLRQASRTMVSPSPTTAAVVEAGASTALWRAGGWQQRNNIR